MIAFLFLISFACLLAGMSGTLPAYRDSGDLIAAAHTLGIAHPPGYAAYILISHGFDAILPIANSAYRINLLSALVMAGAAACLYTLCLCWLKLLFTTRGPIEKKLVSLTASFCFVLTPAAMELGRVAEMYALLSLWAALIIAVLFSKRPNRFILSAFLFGIGLAVHPTLMFVAPVFLGVILSEVHDGPQPYIHVMVFFLLGLSIFIFLPLRAAQSPWLNWGNPSTLRGFWRVVTRSDYGGLKLHPDQSVFVWTLADIGIQLSAFGRAFVGEWGIWGVLVGVVGVYAGLESSYYRRWTFGILASWFIAGPAFFILSNLPWKESTTPAILQPYLVLENILWVPMIAGGLGYLMKPFAWIGIAAVLGGLFLAFGQVPLTTHRDDFYAYDYSRNLLRALPPHAVLFDPDDPTAFGIKMLQAVENRRPDVLLLNFFRTRWGYHQLIREAPELLPQGPVTSAQDLERILWEYSTRRRPFFVELPQKLGTISYRAAGLVYAVMPTEPPEATLLRGEHSFLLNVARGNRAATKYPDFFTKHLIDYYAAADSNLGMEEASMNRREQAIDDYRRALIIDPELSAAYNNWAIIEYGRGHLQEAIRLYKTALKYDPENIGMQRNLQLALANNH